MQFSDYTPSQPGAQPAGAVPTAQDLRQQQAAEQADAEAVLPLVQKVLPSELDATGAPFLGLYFSAHWCGPCKVFTPLLARFYEKYREHLEIAFVSFDRSPDQFAEYSAEMPWHKVPFEYREEVEEIADALKVGGIPCLVILHPDTKRVISYNARGDVQQYLDNGEQLVQLWKSRFGIE